MWCNKRNFIVVFLVLFSVFMIAGNGFCESEDNAFSLKVGPSELGRDFIKIRGSGPKDGSTFFYSLEVRSFENDTEVDMKEFPPRNISEFNVQVDELKFYEFTMIALDESQFPVAHSETIGIPGSHFIDYKIPLVKNKRMPEKTVKTRREATGLQAAIDEVQYDNFPDISAYVTVEQNGQPLTNLTADNFSVLENGIVPAKPIQVLPPQTGGNIRSADFVFIFDHSSSMDDDLERLRNSITAFTQSLVNSGIDYNLAFIPYEYSPLLNIQPLTSDSGEFLSSVDNFLANWPGGSTENAFKAIETGLQAVAWRPGAQKNFILFTDEDDNGGGPTLTEIVQLLNDAQATVHAVVDSNSGYAASDFCDTGSITEATGGVCYDIYSPQYTAILDSVSQSTSSNYVVVYKTSNPDILSGQRHLEITVDVNGEQTTAEYFFDPSGQNTVNITLTLKTMGLSLLSQRKNKAIDIYAKVTETDPTKTLSVTLNYKNSQAAGYQALTMTDDGFGIYHAQIPADQVIDPYIKYYISATDGSQTVSSPTVEATNKPYTISILPNTPPTIGHTAVTSALGGENIIIEAAIKDTTNMVSKAILKYRKQGTRVYQSVDMNATNSMLYTMVPGTDLYKAFIPAAEVEAPGMEYVIYAEDDFGAANTAGTEDNPNVVFVSESVTIPGGYIDVGTLRVWGDQFTPVGDTSSVSNNQCVGVCRVSGNVSIGTIAANKPILGFDSSLEIDTTGVSAETITSTGTTNVTALEIMRNTKKPAENVPLWSGDIEIDPANAVLTCLNGQSIFDYGIKFLFREGNEITIQDNKLTFHGLFTEITNFVDLPLTFSEIVLDQTGNESTGYIRANLNDMLGLGDINAFCDADRCIGKKQTCIGFQQLCNGKPNGCVCVGLGPFFLNDLEFEWDFVKKSFSASAGASFPNLANIIFVKNAAIELGFLYDPVAFDRFKVKAGWDNDTLFLPPHPIGFAPQSLSVGLDNISRGLKDIDFTISVGGPLRDLSKVLGTLFDITKTDILSGKVGADIDLYSNMLEFYGKVSLFDKIEIGKAYMILKQSNVEVKMTIGGEIDLFQILKSEIEFSPSITTQCCDCSVCMNFDLHSAARLQFPQYMEDLPIIGGMAGKGFDVGQYLIISVGDCSPYVLTAEILTEVMGIGLKIDVAPPISLNPLDALDKAYAPRIWLLGWPEWLGGDKQLMRSGPRQNGTGNEDFEIQQEGGKFLVLVYGDNDAPIFDITYPDGTVYHPEDCPFDPSSPNADKIVFLRNEATKEAFYLLTQPPTGTYSINVTNMNDIGGYDFNVLNQNAEPEITITSPSDDMNMNPGDTVTISWTDNDPDNNAIICLYYDTDNEGFNGTSIICDIEEDDTANSYDWTIPESLYGPLYVYAKIDDNEHMPVFAYSTGQIILPDIPRPSVPADFQVTPGDGSMEITWTPNDSSEEVNAYKIYLTVDGEAYTYAVGESPLVLDNLANGKVYEVSMTSINMDGIESNKTTAAQVTLSGTSQDGPPDLTVDSEAEITIGANSQTAQVKVKVRNIADYPAYAYNLFCYYGTMDEDHIIGAAAGTQLDAQSEKEFVFTWDISKLSSFCEAQTIFCQVKDVVLAELNEKNNITIIENTLQQFTEAFSISLSAGFNFISLPFEPANPDISALFGSALGNVKNIWSYDGQWHVFDPEKAGLSDLTEIHALKGYLVWMESPAQICSTGQTVSEVELKEGWNLVGFPKDAALNTGDALASIAGKYESVWDFTGISGDTYKVYDPDNPATSNLTYFVPGYSYWIKATEDCKITFE